MIYGTDERELHSFEGFANNKFTMASTNWNADPVVRQLSVLGTLVNDGEPS